MESQVIYESINVTELSRYIAVAVDVDIVHQRGLSDYAMTRKYKNGSRPTVRALEMEYEWKESKSSWVRARKVPDEGELRKMFALAVSEDVKVVMNNHLFRYRDKFYCQHEGGSIGSELTHQLATCRMIVFVRKLKLRCLNLGLKLYLFKVFVDDDATVFLKFPGRGLVVSGDKLEYDGKKAEDESNVNDDVVAAEILCYVANTLEGESDIKMTFDTFDTLILLVQVCCLS